MAWVATAIVGGAVIGGIATVAGGRSQEAAANKATDAQTRMQQAQTAEEKRQYDLSRADAAPWRKAGMEALNKQGSILEQLGGGMTPKQIMESDPGYQFRQEQGTQALDRSMIGRRLTGRAAKEAMRFGQGLASQEYGAAYARKADLAERYGARAGVGERATTNLANLGAGMVGRTGILAQNTASNIGNIGLAQGTAQGRMYGKLGQIGSDLYSDYRRYSKPSIGTIPGANLGSVPYNP